MAAPIGVDKKGRAYIIKETIRNKTINTLILNNITTKSLHYGSNSKTCVKFCP